MQKQETKNPYLLGYGKGFCTRYELLSLMENWKKALENKSFGGTVLIDLSKVFDTLNYALLIAKLSAYGFTNKSVRLI